MPDYVFGIEFADRPEGQNRRYYFVEIDRGTMPVSRRDILQSSIIRKVQSYLDTYSRKLVARRFGINGFQLLFVTTSNSRIAIMQQAIANLDVGHFPANLFLFRTKEQEQQALPFQKNWTNSKGRPLALF